MTPEQKAAFVIAQSVEVFGLFAGMTAVNAAAAIEAGPPVYRPVDFAKIIEDRGLHHNALITFFQDY